MPTPAITVLMTVYNGERYLKSTIESIVNQTFKDFEFLIIDDCSTDGSQKIIKSYNDPRIRLHINQVNLGQTKSLNIGLNLAKGVYVARIDGDDIALPSWLGTQFSFAQENMDVAVVSTRAVVIDEHNRIVKTLNCPSNFEEIILRSLTSSPINHVGSLMRKDIIIGQGGFGPQYKIAADYALWSRLIKNGYRLTSTPDITMAIRVHQDSISLREIRGANYEETAEIMQQNISDLAGKKMEKSEGILLWKLIYDVAGLSREDFEKGEQILAQYFTAFESCGRIQPGAAKRALRQLLQKIYVKRVFAGIRQNKREDVAAVTLRFIKQHGIFNVFFVFYLISFLGSQVMGVLPWFYEVLIRISARLKTGKQPNLNWAHETGSR